MTSWSRGRCAGEDDEPDPEGVQRVFVVWETRVSHAVAESCHGENCNFAQNRHQSSRNDEGVFEFTSWVPVLDDADVQPETA